MGGIDWGGVAVGFLGILVGAWYSRKANKEAREASGEAKEANEKADQANKIAGQSLEEAREANRLTRDTIDAQRQPDIVEWICRWDTEKRLLTIRNVGESVANSDRLGRQRQAHSPRAGFELGHRTVGGQDNPPDAS